MTKSNFQDLAGFFCSRSGSTGVLVITNSVQLVKQFAKSSLRTFVASDALSQNDLPESVEYVDIESIDESFLADKIVLCQEFLEEKQPTDKLTKLSRAFHEKAVLSITALRQDSKWKRTKFNRFFSKKYAPFTGEFDGYYVAIGGIAANIFEHRFRPVKVLAIVPVYNEKDIIEAVVRHLLKQAVDVHILDNWSNDGSYEIALRLQKKNARRITLERFPARPNNKFELGLTLKRVAQIASQQRAQYDWVMINDADEIRWSPWSKVNLKEAFSFVDSLGYNSVDFTLFNLVPTVDGFNSQKDPRKFFRFGEFPTESWAFLQIKAWKNIESVDLISTGSHHAKINNQMIYPLKFFLAHYPLRSEEQAWRKIFKERKPRFTTEERNKGWSRHYDDMTEDIKFIHSPESLSIFDKKFFSRFLIQRLSGIGIIQKRNK